MWNGTDGLRSSSRASVGRGSSRRRPRRLLSLSHRACCCQHFAVAIRGSMTFQSRAARAALSRGRKQHDKDRDVCQRGAVRTYPPRL
eukprot:4805820-Alexandrium_andersonii.AAC.1